MCYNLEKFAKEVSIANSSQRALLTHYATTAHSTTGLTWHGQESNGDFAGCSTDTIRRRTRDLEELGHISVFRIPGKTTLVLVHPGDADATFKRKNLTWKKVSAHLRKSHYSAATKVDIANWLLQIGWLPECEAIEALMEYHGHRSRKKRHKARPLPSSTPRNLQGHPQHAARAPVAISGHSGRKIGEEYKNNKIKNEITKMGGEIEISRDANYISEQGQWSSNSSSSRRCENRGERKPAGTLTEGESEFKNEEVKRILDGRKRNIDIRDLFAVDQPLPADGIAPTSTNCPHSTQ